MGSFTDAEGCKDSFEPAIILGCPNSQLHPVGTELVVKGATGKIFEVKIMRWGDTISEEMEGAVRFLFKESNQDTWVTAAHFTVMSVTKRPSVEETLQAIEDSVTYVNPTDHPVGTRMFVAYVVDGGISPERDVTVMNWSVDGTEVELQVNVMGGVLGFHKKEEVVFLGWVKEEPNYPHINPADHPVGTKLLVRGMVFEGQRVRDTQVVVSEWLSRQGTFSKERPQHSVQLETLDGSVFVTDGLGMKIANKMWFSPNDTKVLDVLERVDDVVVTNVDEVVNVDFMYHLHELKRLAQEQGLTVSVTIV